MTRAIAAVAAGGLALALAFPTADLHLLSWVALVPLFLLAPGGSAQRAWWLGVLFGVVFRVGTMYWVVDAMTRFGGLPLPLALAGAAALFGYLAIYTGLFALGLRRIATAGASAPWLAAALWVGLEIVQARLFSGFPWLLLGYAGGRSELLVQAADLAGVFGLSFLVVAVNGSLAQLSVHRSYRSVAAVGVLLAVVLAYGAVQADRYPGALGSPLTVGLVQGNVSQDLKQAGDTERLLERHLALTERAAADGADLVLWAESAWPDPWGLERSDSGRARARELAARHGTTLYLGTVRVYEEPTGLEVANGAVMVGSDGALRGGYEKVQLVPFGEYLPFRSVLGALGPLVQAVGELRPGPAVQPPLSDPGGGVPPVGMSICYEVIFPWIARHHVRQGAEILATITNDAWYGRSSAPHQHFAMARVRAVETRRWLVRAANTGISGIVDPAGRVTGSTALFEETVLNGVVSARGGTTLYVRFGDAFAWACLVVSALAVLPGAGARVRLRRSTVRSAR